MQCNRLYLLSVLCVFACVGMDLSHFCRKVTGAIGINPRCPASRLDASCTHHGIPIRGPPRRGTLACEGVFGMNLLSGWEEKPQAFWSVTGGIYGCIVLSIAGTVAFCRRSSLL